MESYGRFIPNFFNHYRSHDKILKCQSRVGKNPGFLTIIRLGKKTRVLLGFFKKKPTDFGFFKIMIFAMYFKRKI